MDHQYVKNYLKLLITAVHCFLLHFAESRIDWRTGQSSSSLNEGKLFPESNEAFFELSVRNRQTVFAHEMFLGKQFGLKHDRHQIYFHSR